MARTMKAGDTWPPLRGEASDAQGNALDLSGALKLEAIIKNASHQIFGVGGSPTLPLAAALQPPVADPDGEHFWNWEYVWVVGDTNTPGVYLVYLKVSWTSTEIQTYPADLSETLTIEAV